MQNNTSTYITLIISILMIVSKFFLNRKANHPGWHAFIPFYSDYLLFKYAKCSANYFKKIVCDAIILIGIPLSLYYLFFQMFVYLENTPVIFDDEIGPLERNIYSFLYSPDSKTVIIAVLIISIICLILSLRFSYIKAKGLSISFQADNDYKWGLFFLPFVFLPILAFSKQYVYYENNQTFKQNEENLFNSDNLSQ